jgi:thymidylate kinase
LHNFKGLSSLLYALRLVVLAWDRQRLILKNRRRAAQGEIIVCDRYPSRTVGAMDSPRLVEEPIKTGLVASIYNRLARLEKQLYQQIPPPDIVLKLRVSLETAKKRNRERNGQDGEAYLEARHRQSRAWHMPETRNVYDIDTEQSLTETILCVKKAIWESL